MAGELRPTAGMLSEVKGAAFFPLMVSGSFKLASCNLNRMRDRLFLSSDIRTSAIGLSTKMGFPVEPGQRRARAATRESRAGSFAWPCGWLAAQVQAERTAFHRPVPSPGKCNMRAHHSISAMDMTGYQPCNWTDMGLSASRQCQRQRDASPGDDDEALMKAISEQPLQHQCTSYPTAPSWCGVLQDNRI